MPELPEVEIVGRGLTQRMSSSMTLKEVKLHRKDLRFDIPKKDLQKLKGQKLKRVFRIAKYLFFEFDAGYMVSHLGMTGFWRSEPISQRDLKKHDHFELHWEDQQSWIYNDPRRFGFIDFTLDPKEYLKGYGPDPFSEEFSAAYLFEKLKGKASALKVSLMDQAVVVGIGNIYASELLHLCGINPSLAAGKASKADCQKIVQAARKVLDRAIQAGGSSISDFKNAEGQSGYFQMQFSVYDREGENCRKCKTSKIKAKVLGGRSTYWCSKCQK